MLGPHLATIIPTRVQFGPQGKVNPAQGGSKPMACTNAGDYPDQNPLIKVYTLIPNQDPQYKLGHIP